MNVDTWAKAAHKRRPQYHDYVGCSYEEASRRAQAICRAAGESGITLYAASYLAEFAKLMQILVDRRAA